MQKPPCNSPVRPRKGRLFDAAKYTLPRGFRGRGRSCKVHPIIKKSKRGPPRCLHIRPGAQPAVPWCDRCASGREGGRMRGARNERHRVSGMRGKWSLRGWGQNRRCGPSIQPRQTLQWITCRPDFGARRVPGLARTVLTYHAKRAQPRCSPPNHVVCDRHGAHTPQLRGNVH